MRSMASNLHYNQPMRYKFLVTILSLQPVLAAAQTIFHVDQNVQGGQQTGLNWANAFPNLQQALAVAHAGDEIWVAKGVYYPTTTTDRSISFVLKQGVGLYGGFAGTEASLLQRDFIQNETLLSGNIGNPLESTDNSRSIVTGQGLDSTACIDGFILKHCYAEASGSALFLSATIQAPVTSPAIRNCRFEQNYANEGPALYCQYNSVGIVSPALKNCIFRYNKAQTSGGAVVKKGPSPAAFPFVVEDCIFSDNRVVAGNGGALCLSDHSGLLALRRCQFARDSAFLGLGGAVYYPGYSGGSTLTVDSCSFVENYADGGAGICYDEFSTVNAPGPLTCYMNHTIFDHNLTRADGGAAFGFWGFVNSMIQLYVDHCSIKNNLSGSEAACFITGATNSNTHLSIKNTEFFKNINKSNPASTTAALYYSLSGDCSANIENCVFARNGAGILTTGGDTNGNKLVSHITNCTFFSNGKEVLSKSWYQGFNDSTFYSKMYIDNCIFWENTTSDRLFSDGIFNMWIMEGFFIDHVCIKREAGEFFGLGPNVLYQTYPEFVDTSQNNFRLRPCSPAVNFGDNLATNNAALVVDLDGNLRIVQDTVDLGAYETQDTCGSVSAPEKPDLGIALQINPNPVSSGGTIVVVLPAVVDTGIPFHWRLNDLHGRLVAEGDEFEPTCMLKAPECPGVYSLTIQEKHIGQVVRLFVVVK